MEEELFVKLNTVPFITPDIISNIKTFVSKQADPYVCIFRLINAIENDYSIIHRSSIDSIITNFTKFKKYFTVLNPISPDPIIIKEFIDRAKVKYDFYLTIIQKPEYFKYSSLITFLFQIELNNLSLFDII